jgi:hypothetical protein
LFERSLLDQKLRAHDVSRSTVDPVVDSVNRPNVNAGHERDQLTYFVRLGPRRVGVGMNVSNTSCFTVCQSVDSPSCLARWVKRSRTSSAPTQLVRYRTRAPTNGHLPQRARWLSPVRSRNTKIVIQRQLGSISPERHRQWCLQAGTILGGATARYVTIAQREAKKRIWSLSHRPGKPNLAPLRSCTTSRATRGSSSEPSATSHRNCRSAAREATELQSRRSHPLRRGVDQAG